MTGKTQRRDPEVILRHGRPAAVILDIEEYQKILERLEDVEDIESLEKMKRRPLKFRKLEDFLKDYHPDV